MDVFSESSRRFAAKFAIDLALWTTAALLAFLLRLEGDVSQAVPALVLFTLAGIPVKAGSIYGFDLHRQAWRKAGVRDVLDLSVAIGVGEIVLIGIALMLHVSGTGMPRTVPLIEALLAVFLMAGVRIGTRVYYERSKGLAADGEAKRVLIAGAGEAGTIVAREMQRHAEAGLVPVAFVDDERLKQRRRYLGLTVVGTIDDIPDVVRRGRIDEVLIAMPSASGEVVRRVIDRAREVEVRYRILPGVYELLAGRVGLTEIREVQVDDLLRRDPVEMNAASIAGYLRGKTVLVTGAGGSIGAELVRQVAAFEPERVVLLGAGENSLHRVDRELEGSWPDLRRQVVIASIRDARKIEVVMDRFAPDVVFHAAAHKHVPLMEGDPDEAVLNNVAGTKIVAEAALRSGVERFVNISTDKAVAPISILGATKLIAEEIVRRLATMAERGRSFVSVRFGNVLGSRGSVVPIFREQIARGGPVTITDPEMTRFLMTIPEASQLVIQAAAFGDNGAIYVLDMGEPVRMVDLARDMIQLFGFRPDDDIPIEFTGVRPGEKLHEAMFAPDERRMPTSHEKIFTAKRIGDFDADFRSKTTQLLDSASERDLARMFATLGQLVSSYEPGEWLSVENRGAVTHVGARNGV